MTKLIWTPIVRGITLWTPIAKTYKKTAKKLSYNLQRELDALPKTIDRLETA